MSELLCPVCGFGLESDPERSGFRDPLWHVICPCCGIQFGYDDEGGSGFCGTKEQVYRAYRSLWIRFGMPWVHGQEPKPVGWDTIEQLRRIGIEFHPSSDSAWD